MVLPWMSGPLNQLLCQQIDDEMSKSGDTIMAVQREGP